MRLVNVLSSGQFVVEGVTSKGQRVTLEHLVSGDRRQRIEMSPVYIPLPDGNFWKIFDRGGCIVGDPNNTNPARPVGHCFEDHVKGDTQRWNPDLNVGFVQLIHEADNNELWWPHESNPFYDDGGSRYYKAISDPLLRKQVSKSSGRTMIGILVPNTLVITTSEGMPVRIDFYLQYRMVTDDGGDTRRSPRGTTQFAMGPFVLDLQA